MIGFLKIRTHRQVIFLIPWLVGALAGLCSLIYLLAIPADSKNSILLGFSLFRLLEALIIFVGTIGFSVICTHIARDFEFTSQVLHISGWESDRPWSILTAWCGILASLIVIFFGNQIFPGSVQVLQRISPIIYWLAVFFLSFLLIYFFWIEKSQLVENLRNLYAISLFFLLAILCIGLIFFPSNIGLILRKGSLLIPFLFIWLFHFAYRQKTKWQNLIVFLLLVILFGGSLIGVWASGITDLNIIGGLLPYNDANGYYHGARLLSVGLPFHDFSARRPLFPAVLGIFYALGNENLQFAIACTILLIILAVYFSAKEIKQSSGPLLAGIFIVGVFLFIRRFIGSTMSEILGLPLGIIGFGLLWRSASRKKVGDAFWGTLLLCLGLIARAGPFFILPMLVIWSGWFFRKDSRFNIKSAVIIALAVIIGFCIHLTIFNFLAGENSSSMGNFSYTLYGLVAGGKGWKQYGIDHPELLNMVEPELSRTLYRYSLESFRNNPLGLIQGAIVYWKAFFSMEWYGMFGFIEGISLTETMIGRILMALVSFIGVSLGMWHLKKPANSMVMAGFVGIILSVPFVPPLDAEIRTYAAGIPWFIGLALIGLTELSDLLSIKKHHLLSNDLENDHSYGIRVFAAILVCFLIIGPLFVHFTRHAPILDKTNGCNDGEERVVTILSRGSLLNIEGDDNLPKTFVPNLRKSDLVVSMHDSPMYDLGMRLLSIPEGASFLQSYDWEAGKFVYIWGETRLFTENQGWVELCGRRDKGSEEYPLFHAESARLLTDQVSNELR
ncbi:hypothetical protein [Leptolinea tardivitalis]|uniref:Glycosyltransferase RgtA/B/C/D-like domain-containing protein n=1 Tax=Leptolinea tardivitalis TaxID=229920 RepID=A0A0P6XQC3_9CHLR|nr:hypothetical protein [Leptolinea tardivitalis]KPL71619.1 hypothetical protein ADM99_09035 [Leptolinea tardivitalis]GAP19945.1 hypothetical protein LTAR_00129 [Leptolinea tardivitalis]